MRWTIIFALVLLAVVTIEAGKKEKKAKCKADNDCAGEDGSPGCCVTKTWTNPKGKVKTKGKCSRRPFAVTENRRCKADCECQTGLKCVKAEGAKKGKCQDGSALADDPTTAGAAAGRGGRRGGRKGGRGGRGRGGRGRGGRGGGRGGRGGRGPAMNFTSCSDDKPCPSGFCCVQMPASSRRGAGDKICLPTKFEVPNQRCVDSCQCNKEDGYFCYTKNAKNKRRGKKGRCLTKEMAEALNAPHGKWLGEAPAGVDTAVASV